MLVAVYCTLEVYADEDKSFSFPAARPEQVGMNQAKLEQAKRYSQSAGGSGMVVRHGRVVLRWGDQKKRYDIKSATKSFGATMLGIAIKDGKIELDTPARRYHPTFGVPPQSNANTGWLDEITIRHLATQTAGFEKPGGYEKLLFKPGTQWHYSDGGPNWLAECITLQYRRDLEDLMFDRVFTPLGITRDDLQWRTNQYRKHEIEGISRREFGAGIHANVEALMRLGYLYLHKGSWKNKQILPREFVDIASRPINQVVGLPEWSDTQGNASDHYSLLWWNNADGTLENVPRDAYWAWGLYDSLIVVVPSLDLVVVRGGERGKRLPREDGANHYDVLKQLLEPIAAAVLVPDKVKVAAVQIGGYDKWLKIKDGCNPVESVVKYVERAARDGVQLVVFPEYHLGRISVPGSQTQKISKATAENSIYVIVGCWEVFNDESFSSTALLFGRDGDIVGKYYKTHAAVDTYDELPAYSKPPSEKGKQWFIENDPEWIMKRGNNLPVFDLDFGRIGILICYDGYFSETYSVLSLKGAEIIVWINGRGGSIQDYYVRTFMEQNLVSMICTNQDYGSGTMLAQYPNKIDAVCRQPGEDYIITEFNLKKLRIARKNSRNFQQRRPELYKEITKPHPIWENYKNVAK